MWPPKSLTIVHTKPINTETQTHASGSTMHYTKTNTKQDGTRRKQKLANEKLRWTEWLAGQSISQGNRLNPVGSDLSCETLEMGKVFLQRDTDLAGKLRTKQQYKNVLPCAPMCSLSH